MAISYPRAYPSTNDFRRVSLNLRAAVPNQDSPFGLHSYAQDLGGRRWELGVNLVPRSRADADQWISWLESLQGGLKTFLGGDPSRDDPRGTAATTPGTPLVNGGSQTGTALVVDGLPTSQNGYLLNGDFIQLGSGASSELYRLLEDVNTDGGGNATLTLNRPLLNSPANNAAVTVSGCRSVFKLLDPIPNSELDVSLYGIRFRAVEKISVS